MELVPVERLKHIEGYSAKRAESLKKKILEEQVWTRPLCIDRTHGLVMDGQHRMEVARALGLAVVPCELFDYHEVEVWSLRDNHEVDADLIIAKALAGEPYPYKTAKHRFPREIPDIAVPLASLYPPASASKARKT